MGDTKKIRKKYQKPNHPYNKDRIDSERRLKNEYGLLRKKELWKAETVLKGFKDQIKQLPSMSEHNADTQRKLLRARLKKLGLVNEDTPLGDVLGYNAEAILERRLQTLVFKKGMARTAKQARQFILHEHILVNGKKINAPSYLVPKQDEDKITFVTKSALADEQHPEREQVEKKQKKAKNVEQKPAEEQPEVVELDEEDEDLE